MAGPIGRNTSPSQAAPPIPGVGSPLMMLPVINELAVIMELRSSVVRGPAESTDTWRGSNAKNSPAPITVRGPLSWYDITGIGSLSVARRGNDKFAVPTVSVVKAEESIVAKLGPVLLKDKVMGPV
jgi:hypothetical protein